MSDEADFNPYEAPTEAAEGLDEAPEDGRVGPPWEMPGRFLGRFFDTANGIVRRPSEIFAKTRREGNESAARNYALLAGTIGMVGFSFYSMAIIAVFELDDALKGLPPEKRGEWFLQSVGGLLCCAVLPIPLWLLVCFYVHAAILHLSLFFVGGAQRRMGTTFRAYAYAMSTGLFWNIIPIYGWFTLLQLWYTLPVALAELQGISRWRAFFALLLIPVTVVVLYIGFFVFLILMVILITGKG